MESGFETANSVKLNRRNFTGAAAASALVALAGGPGTIRAESRAEESCASQYRTGNGEWTYDIVPHWGQLPAGKQFGGTHGAINSDKAGNV
jgi:hypothetical protein